MWWGGERKEIPLQPREELEPSAAPLPPVVGHLHSDVEPSIQQGLDRSICKH